MATRWMVEMKSRLAGSKSIARHGRATKPLKAARLELHKFIAERKAFVAGESGLDYRNAADVERVRAALSAHDDAVFAMTGVRRIAHPPLY